MYVAAELFQELARNVPESLGKPMRVRTYRESDAEALGRIFFDSVHQLASSHYSREQLQAWAPRVPPAEAVREWQEDGRLTLVAVDCADAPRAFTDLRPDGYVDHLFCAPAAARSGAATLLHRALEERAREMGLGRLWVHASECARPFYEKQRFSTVERRDFHLGGIPIHNYLMEKALGRADL